MLQKHSSRFDLSLECEARPPVEGGTERQNVLTDFLWAFYWHPSLSIKWPTHHISPIIIITILAFFPQQPSPSGRRRRPENREIGSGDGYFFWGGQIFFSGDGYFFWGVQIFFLGDTDIFSGKANFFLGGQIFFIGGQHILYFYGDGYYQWWSEWSWWPMNTFGTREFKHLCTIKILIRTTQISNICWICLDVVGEAMLVQRTFVQTFATKYNLWICAQFWFQPSSRVFAFTFQIARRCR